MPVAVDQPINRSNQLMLIRWLCGNPAVRQSGVEHEPIARCTCAA